MSETVVVNKEDFADFLKSFEEKVESKRNELLQLEKRLAQYKGGVTSINSGSNNTKLNGYNPEWTFVQKINYFLNSGGKTTTEIADLILASDVPTWSHDRAKLVGTVSAILSARSKDDGTYTKLSNERNINVYSLKKPH